MTFHHRERRTPASSRRQFLQLGALAAVSGTAVAACGKKRERSTVGDQVVLSRPDKPARLPTFTELPPISDGMSPEKGGTLKLLNYADYIDPATIKKFGREYGVTVEVTTFTTQQELAQKLRTAGTSFDVCFPTPDYIGRMVQGKLLRPLNRKYIPNLGNAWTQLQDPFYDQGSQYSVPYTTYTTGVGYRADRVKNIPANGYDLLGDTAFKGQIYLLEDARETLCMEMLKVGKTDINTEDKATVEAAGQALQQLTSAVNIKTGISAYQIVPQGQATIHQCWSGDMINAQYYLPKNLDASVLGYWYPSNLTGVVGTDCMAIPANASKPVLAHIFLNYILDNDNALANFGFTGYQPALTIVTPDKMVQDEYVTENLRPAIVTPEHYAKGLQILQLSGAGDQLWDDTYARFKAGQ